MVFSRTSLTQEPCFLTLRSSKQHLIFLNGKVRLPMDQQLTVKFLFFEASASGLVSVILIFVLAILAMGLTAYLK
jgi:hypothetical protein